LCEAGKCDKIMEKKENINLSGEAMKRIEKVKNVVTPVDFSDNSKIIPN
jgi:hypothetical protein